MAIFVLISATEVDGVDDRESVAGEVDIASFVVDLTACRAKRNVRSQIFGPLVGRHLFSASIDRVALGTEVHTVRGRIDVDNAIVE